MLVIPEETKEYFIKVRIEAYDRGLMKEFNEGMLNAHLFGCTWEAPDQVRCVLFEDFAPLSFGFRMEQRQEDDNYKFFMNGGLIYEGPDSPANGQAPSFTVTVGESRIGWFMHT